jgi:hypothetical protein
LTLLHDYLEGDPPLMNYAKGWDDTVPGSPASAG